MKYKKRPRPNDPPPPWNPYLIMKMSDEEADPLLWIPQVVVYFSEPVLKHFPAPATERVCQYGVPVRVDDESQRWLTCKYTWLTFNWVPRGIEGIRQDSGPSKIHLYGIDDFNYGIWLNPISHQAYLDTWPVILAFLDECGAREFGLNGEYLMDWCDEYLDVWERDYN